MSDVGLFVQFGHISEKHGERLKNCVYEVLAGLPKTDLDMIARKKVMLQEGKIDDGLTFGLCEPEMDPWMSHKCVITIDPEVIPLDDVLRAIIAHELAHARLDHHNDVKRWRTMNLPQDRRAAVVDFAEKMAHEQMRKWGFSRERDEWLLFAQARRLAMAKQTI